MGKRKGLDEARGTLFYEYARLVSEIKPKVFIYENVTGMLNHDGGQTWKVISDIFDDLGYCWKYWVLNAKDYGLPQNRRRIFVVGFQKQYESLFLKLSEPPKQKLNSVLSDYLEQDIPNKYYLPEKDLIELRILDKKTCSFKWENSSLPSCLSAVQLVWRYEI